MTTESATQSPEPIITPFTILVDSREQMPWHFQGFEETRAKTVKGERVKVSHPLVVKTRQATLGEGDYSLEGWAGSAFLSESPWIAIERKSLSDLFSTLLSDRDRFTRELERLAAYRYSAVVVESSWALICNNNEYEPSKIKSVIGSIMAFDQRYPTSWWFLPTRAEAERFCFRALERFWKDRQG